MVIIRLQRVGKKHQAHFRVVAADKNAPVKGRFLEIIGHFHPKSEKDNFSINEEKLNIWLKNGARVSDTVNNLLVKAGIFKKEQIIKKTVVKKKEEEEKPKTDQPAEKEDQPKAGGPSGAETKEEISEEQKAAEDKEKMLEQLKQEEAEKPAEQPEPTAENKESKPE